MGSAAGLAACSVLGSVGGVAGITLVYPLDTAKMRLQTHSQYRGLSDCLRTMVREEGWGSLYRGLLSPQVGFGVTFSLSFAANGQATRWVREWHNDPSESSWVGLPPCAVCQMPPLTASCCRHLYVPCMGYCTAERELTTGEMVLAGTWAGIVQSPARQVFERIKSVMQVQHGAGGKPPYSVSARPPCLPAASVLPPVGVEVRSSFVCVRVVVVWRVRGAAGAQGGTVLGAVSGLGRHHR